MTTEPPTNADLEQHIAGLEERVRTLDAILEGHSKRLDTIEQELQVLQVSLYEFIVMLDDTFPSYDAELAGLCSIGLASGRARKQLAELAKVLRAKLEAADTAKEDTDAKT